MRAIALSVAAAAAVLASTALGQPTATSPGDGGVTLAACRAAATRTLGTCRGADTSTCPQRWALSVIQCGRSDPAGLVDDIARWRASDEAQHAGETSLATTLRFAAQFELGTSPVDAQPPWFERATTPELEATESATRAVCARLDDEKAKETGRRVVPPMDRELTIGMAIKRAAAELQCRADRACMSRRAALRGDAG